MTTVLKNGKIYLRKGVFAQALLIRDGVIRAAGKDTDMPDSPGVRVFDCRGRTVLPGFHDSHCHLYQTGTFLARARLEGCTSLADVIRTCRDYLETHPEARKNGLQGEGWNQDRFTDGSHIPNRHDLDRIAENIPVLLYRVCGHIVCANTCALQKAGITAATPQPESGRFGIGSDGLPDGIFYECGGLISGTVPGISLEEGFRCFRQVSQEAVSYGVTAVQSNDAAARNDAFLRRMETFYAEGKGLLRYRHQVCCSSPEQVRTFFARERAAGCRPSCGLLSLGPLKLFADGSLGGRTALLRGKYADDPGNRGQSVISSSELAEFCKAAAESGVQVITHAIGDGAVEQVLDAYAAVTPKGNPLRHGIVHCQITGPGQLRRIAAMELEVLYQPAFLEYDLHIVRERVGTELASTSYAFRSLSEMGGKVSFGTDSPVESLNPFCGLHCAVTRTDYSGRPAGGLFPQERMDISDAIDAYTLGSARAAFAEGRLGRLLPGYCADLVVTDRDVFTCAPEDILHTVPVLTMVAGNDVFKGDL